MGSGHGPSITSAPPPFLQVAKANGFWVSGAFKTAVDLISWASETKFKIKQFTTHWLPEPPDNTGHVYGVRKDEKMNTENTHLQSTHISLGLHRHNPQSLLTGLHSPDQTLLLIGEMRLPLVGAKLLLAWTTSFLGHSIPFTLCRCLSEPRRKCYECRPNTELALTRMSLHECTFFQLPLKSSVKMSSIHIRQMNTVKPWKLGMDTWDLAFCWREFFLCEYA